MKILEIIHLRLAGETSGNMYKLMRELIGPDPEGMKIRFYRHVKLANDLRVHLHREAAGGDLGASEAGIRLAALLKDYGMVEHSVWTRCSSPEEACLPKKNA
jgi:hypothetical protein